MRTSIGKPADRWASVAIAPGFLAAFSGVWLGVMLVVRPDNVGITPFSVLVGCVLLPLLVAGVLVPTLALCFRSPLAAATARRRDRRHGTCWLGAELPRSGAGSERSSGSPPRRPR
ncbi:MAG TPA: hypothetical protein VJP77_09685, partial [Planctomycetota bacterium]|nr:hypothetical protein [Planctomycetota bacterium]